MGKAAVNRNGTIFNKSHMLLAYADDVDIIGHGLRDDTAAFSSIKKQSAEVGLVILGRCVNVDNYNCEALSQIGRMRWLGHVVPMDDNAPARKTLGNKIDVRRRRGRPKLRWMDQVKELLTNLGVTNYLPDANTCGY